MIVLSLVILFLVLERWHSRAKLRELRRELIAFMAQLDGDIDERWEERDADLHASIAESLDARRADRERADAEFNETFARNLAVMRSLVEEFKGLVRPYVGPGDDSRN